jgi:hypothetical protein
MSVFGPIWRSNWWKCGMTFVLFSPSFISCSFLAFASCFLLYAQAMDDYRCKRLVLVFIMAMHPLVAQVVSLQQVVIGQHWGRMREFIYLFLNLLTCHQKFGAYGGGVRGYFDTWKISFLGAFPRRCFINVPN